MTHRYLFDSHSLLAFFQKKKGAEIVAKIMEKAMAQQMDRLVCLINLGEIIYITKRNFGDTKKLVVAFCICLIMEALVLNTDD